MARIDADDIYDKVLELVNRALEGEVVPYEKITAAQELLKPIMQSIYFQRSRGHFPNVIGGDDDD
jgi:hypothetical protein